MRARFNVLRAAVLAAAGAMLALPISANAAIIHFDQANEGGTIVYDGSDYVGTSIIFENIGYNGRFVYCGAAQNGGGGTSDTDCLLDFDTNTGAFVVTAQNGLYTDCGGTCTGVLIPGVAAAQFTVLTGTGMTSFGHIGSTVGIDGTDTKLAALLTYFGLAADEWVYANSNIVVGGVITGAGTYTVGEADIFNTDVTDVPIPEPGLLALFGLGLVGLGRHFTRRRK